MIYLSQFEFPTREREYDFIMAQKRICYNSYYPFLVLSEHALTNLVFEPVTILYGGNGSGKTTVLNVIAEKLGLKRDALYNRSAFFEDYTKLCSYEADRGIPDGSRIVTSDDVFDFMLNVRSINEGIDRKREELFEDYRSIKDASLKGSSFQLKSLEDYEQLKKVNAVRSRTQSKFVKQNLKENVREHSNGESAFLYFSEKIRENSLYLLDEPENSLSPERQQELLKFLEDSARFFGCQFIISTHSPFLLSMRGARIYDMDEETVAVKRWTELKNVRDYYSFFKEHEKEFDHR